MGRGRNRGRGARLLGAFIAWALVTGWASSAYAAPARPTWIGPADGLVAARATLRVLTGADTSSLTVSVNGVVVGSTACTSGVVVGFGPVGMPGGVTMLTALASNGVETTSSTYAVTRIEYPWSTCLIIDKGDFRLYWIQDDELVRAYPIAHGKRRSPTPNAIWRVGRKEITPWRSVYGPRKLRLFRQVTVRTRRGRVRVTKYVFTRFGIHGTNEPWVIGTLASHGCIRLTNDQILDLWPQVPVGTMVQSRP